MALIATVSPGASAQQEKCLHQKTGKSPSEAEVRIQRILDETSDEEELQKLLRKEGRVGTLIANYVKDLDNLMEENILNSNDGSYLDNFVNYQIVRILSLDFDNNSAKFFEKEQHIDKINERYCIYKTDDPMLNIIKLVSFRKQKRQQIDDKETIESLRYTARFKRQNHLRMYQRLLQDSSPEFLQSELNYWNKFFREEICAETSSKSQCISQILEKIKNHSFKPAIEIAAETICNVKVIDQSRLFEFQVCKK